MSSENPYDAGSAEPQSDLPPSQGEPPTKEETNMAMLAHLLGGLLSILGLFGLPLGFLGSLIIWLMKKDESQFVDDQGKEALNFQLTWLIAYIVSCVLWGIIIIVTCGIGAFLPIPLIVICLQVIFGIVGAMKASNGELYRYPITIRMIK